MNIRVLSALPLCLFAVLPVQGAHAADAPAERPRVMVVPAAPLGDVRPVFEKRIAKGIADVLKTSAAFDVVTDKDKVADKVDPKKGPVKVSTASKRIDAADAVRQEGIDLKAEGKWKEALEKFEGAIALYEKAYLELVDYTKLADAYSQAGIAAFNAGRAAADVTRHFELGIALQPTLVIDRRKQDKALLEAFDNTHERMDKATKATIEIDGQAPGSVEVYVDGVKVGDTLPAKAAELLPGTHYAQVRGDGIQPWGAIVKVKGKDTKITAKLVAIKAEEKRIELPGTIDLLGECAKTGNFHQPMCKNPSVKLGKQTGATYFVFAAIKADRFGRLTVHPFLYDVGVGAVPIKPVELAADLSDLNKRMAELEAEVSKSVEAFPKAKVLNKAPTVYSAK